MSKTKFLVRQVANSLYFVVSKDKEAVWAEQVIGKKECVMGGYEHLVVTFKQSLANLIGKFVVVESIKLVDEDERSVVHLFQPIILPQFGITERLIQYKCSVHTPPSHAIRSG